MTDTEANQAAVEPGLDEAAPPPAEPWTPRRVAEWNAYYDVYVAAFVLALAFLGSANKIPATSSELWTLLQTGRQIADAGSPIGLGGSTVAGEGQRWVNIPWLFEVIQYQVFKTVAAVAAPANPAPPAGDELASRGEQVAAGALVTLNALIRALTAWLLLGLRRRGPGLWWTALCVAAALGVTLSPEPIAAIRTTETGETVQVILPAIGIQLGGIANTAAVSPETWGALFLALELFVLHHAINLGKTRWLFALVPLFAVWANTDEMFAVGLLILAATAIGRVFDGKRTTMPSGPSPRTTSLVLAACCAATCLNPSHIFGVLGGFGTLFRFVGLTVGPPSSAAVSLFGAAFSKSTGAAFARAFQVYYAILVFIGLASFALNRQRFSWGRFLVFVVASLLWMIDVFAFRVPFALVFVAVLALNGQEWYHALVGTEGRLGKGWVAWSTGGRLVTIALIFAAIFRSTTGWGGQVGESQFGFGFNPDDFPFEAADAVAASPIEGNVLNTTLAQGDALAWRAPGKRKAYIDSKRHLYAREVLAKFDDLRKAIRDDKVETWRPILDGQKITAVLIETAGAPLTYTKLMNSPNWIPFYDDGATVMFGRGDAATPPADLAYFQANRLDAQELAYKRPKPVPAWFGVPRQVSELVDSVFQNRLLNRPQPHIDAARHWLRPVTVPAGTAYLPDPAHCLLAIRELRAALSKKPDDYTAFRLLVETYRLLFIQESALLGGIKPTPENAATIARVTPQPRVLFLRYRQLLTSFNFLLQTLPPARTAADRGDRANLNFNLAQYYLENGYLDLARERRLAIDGREGELPEDFFRNQTQLLGELNQALDQVQAQLGELMTQPRVPPLLKANTARNGGAPGLAIRELEEAEQAGGGGQGGVRSSLVDLYCDSGQPDKALEVISLLNIDDPSLSTVVGTTRQVGTATHRQGMVYFLLGDYRNAMSLWGERSIVQLRTERLLQAPIATQSLLRGEPIAATRMFIELPERTIQQAEWEFEVGMAALEGGSPPPLAAEHLRTALELEPNLSLRPVIAYYLEQLGEAVPPLREPNRATTPPPSSDTPPATTATPPTEAAPTIPGPTAPPSPGAPPANPLEAPRP